MAKASDIYYKLSPFSLVAIVMLNFLLIYLNLVNLENQTAILRDISENTQIALENQKLGLNVSSSNEELIQHVIELQTQANETFYKVVEHVAANKSATAATD